MRRASSPALVSVMRRALHRYDPCMDRFKFVDTNGRLYGGPFVADANPFFVTFAVTLEEWLPEADA